MRYASGPAFRRALEDRLRARSRQVGLSLVRLRKEVAFDRLHAYTRGYGQAGVQSTRVKDLVDLVLIATSRSIDAAELRSAIDSTVASRGLHGVPKAFPGPPTDWDLPFRRMASEVGMDDDLRRGYQTASLLLDPILDGSTSRAVWDPITKRWSGTSRFGAEIERYKQTGLLVVSCADGCK